MFATFLNNFQEYLQNFYEIFDTTVILLANAWKLLDIAVAYQYLRTRNDSCAYYVL